MKILVVKLSAFGDIIHALPALHDLLERPEVQEVHWLVDSRYAFVSKVFPAEVKVHQVDMRGKRPIQSAWRTIRTLRQQHFDAILDLQGLSKSAIMASLSGSPVYGMDEDHLREKFARLLLRPVPFHADERHVVQMYRRVASAPFGNSAEAIAYTPPQAESGNDMRQTGEALLEYWKISSQRFVWLHMGGGWATKQLPLNTWQRLAEELASRDMIPVLGWGNHTEQALATKIKVAVPASLLPEHKLKMEALCGVLTQAVAVVGPDTGVVHLAAALGVPTVSFWGPSASWRSAPLGENHRHIESNPHCGPCFKRTCGAFICMDMIDANDIISAIHELSPDT